MNKKLVSMVAAVGLAFTQPGFCADDQTINMEQIKSQYRGYLEQLKALNQQYKQITGQVAQVVKEEGLPTWQSSPAETQLAQMVGAAYGDSRIKQTDREIRVYLELPGLLRSTLKVSLDNEQTLRVIAQKRVADEVTPIDQKVELPVPALEKGASAKYEDGVLQVTIPKASPKPAVASAGIPVR